MTCRQLLPVLSITFLALVARPAQPGAFLINTMIQTDSPDAVTHPLGYDGTGGSIAVTVCIDPASPSAAELTAPTVKAVDTLNALVPTTGT